MGIESVQNTFQPFAAQGMQPGVRQAEGSFLGNAVQVAPTPAELLADAAEELSFSADTTDDFELEERKVKDKSDQAMAERVKLYQELMHQAGKSEQMSSLRDSLRTREDSRRALDKAREYFPDPSDAWAALLDIREQLRNEGVDPEILQDIDDAVSDLERQEGPAIRAGVQGALSAKGFEDLGSVDGMRDLYRETVCSFTSVNEVFEHVQQKYGEDFDRSMDFLFAALSADIASDQPSMGISHLESVYGSLGKVRLTQSAYRLCSSMLDRWENVHGVKPQEGGLTSMELLKTIINFKDIRFLGGMHIDPLLQKAHAPDIEHEVLFLQELMNTSRDFPSELFDGDQGRMKVLDAVQEAVDKAIEREDEYLASLEN
ncbi:MAG: type III secretion system gatekeeper subunit SctW [Mailhella sp.]|nr:type III secretion system gatekeeper subunit SctW [Mailhella sp.]